MAMLDHQMFVSQYREQKLKVYVDQDKAGHMYQGDTLPQNIRAQQAKLRTVGFLLVIISIPLFFFYKVWVAIVVLLIGLGTFPFMQSSAAKGVLKASLQDEDVYKEAIENGTLRYEEGN